MLCIVELCASDAGFKESLPGQVRAPAVFKCVRVTAVEDGQDEYAYQAVVKIGGHVFKGLSNPSILYPLLYIKFILLIKKKPIEF